MFLSILRGFAFAVAAAILVSPTISASQSPLTYGGALKGCFKDTSDFDLNGYLERSRFNSVQRCVDICAKRGFRYAGVQYSESCLCGNSYGRYGPANNCTMACTGYPEQICGGYASNAVYEIFTQGAGTMGPGAATTAPRSPVAKACSAEADAKGLHGEARQRFRKACKYQKR